MVDFQERDTRREQYLHSSDDGEGGDESGHDESDRDESGHGHREDHSHGDHHDDRHDHHHQHDVETIGTAVVTVSSSRSLDDDPAGDAIVAAFEDAGHEVVTRELVADEYDTVQGTISNVATRGDVDVVVTTGGTGVTPDDVTIEAVKPLFGKRLPGFGELFRRRSYDEIGTRVVATRATAGVVVDTESGHRNSGDPESVTDAAVVFCLPGSENAARLGTEEIIVPEAGHLAGLAKRSDPAE